EEVGGLDGEALAARDCACVGEGFLDPLAPLCVLACGEDEEGFPVTVHCVVVGDVQGKLLICLPAAAWRRKVAKRTVPRGFLSKVIAAEVAAASGAERAVELPGQTVRVWLGFCEGEAEQSIQVSDAPPSVNFGALPNGDLLVPFAEALALLWQHQVSGSATTPMHTANEGTEAPGSLPERLASIERTLASLVPSLGSGATVPAAPQPVTRAKAGPAVPQLGASAAARPQELGEPVAYPGLDQSVVAAALASGVAPHVLGEMSRLVEARPLHRLRAEPQQGAATRRPTPLDESEEEAEAYEPVGAPAVAASSAQPAKNLESAEAFAQAMVRCLDSLKSGSGKQTALDRALDASGGGSLDGSLNSGRRNAAARKALRDSLASAPQEISKMIESLMAEDLNASTPGAGSPVLTSTRALNIALLQADQCSIDRGSWLLAQELLREEAEFTDRRQKLSHRTTTTNKEQAPCLSLPALWNSMPRALCRCSGSFASFLRSALRSEPNRAPTPFTWPCPLPFPEASDANRPGLWKKRLINLTVARLSYEHLGCPSSCPSTIRLGVPLNRKQWQQVKNLEHLVFGSFFPLTFEPQDYGRIGHKVEGQAKTLSALGRAAASVCRGFSAGYLPRSVSVEGAPSDLGPSPVQIVGTLPGKPDIAAMPIVADRVKLPACPTFVASPYMDRTTADFFENPLHHARVPDPAAERPPFVKILADSRQKLLLLQALARSGRLEPLSSVPREREDWGAGLFAVAKDGARDRLVLDARPANELENFPGRWVHTLASAACLGCLNLRPDEVLMMCGTDLQDCFYQFKATPERLVRNHLACKLTLSEAAFVFGRPADSFQAPGGFVWCGLSSLAMGDSSACEFAQCSHLGVLAQARVVHAGELLVQAAAPPRGLLSVGLVIDDLIVLQRCLASQLPFFAENPGRYSDKKTFEDKTQ
ncbi:unnamed protein product, partial [Symbiodinium necroappetens]